MCATVPVRWALALARAIDGAPPIHEGMHTPRGNTVIESLGVYLPERSVTTTEIVDGCKRRLRFPLEHTTGIRSRRMAADGEFAIDLAKQAVARCLTMSQYAAADVDVLVCCNISRYDGPEQGWYEPSTSVRLRKALGFTGAMAADISNACAGVFTGIAVVESLLRSGAIRRGMVVSGEHITHLTRTAQRDLKGFTDPRLACLTLGDAAVALLLESGADRVSGLLAIEIYTLGRYSDYCIGRANDKPGGGAIMLTDVIRLSNVAIDEATAHAVAVQSRAGWSAELMSQLIMHQTSERTIQRALGRVNELYGKDICSDRNVVFNLADRGNTASTSHFVAFHDKVLDGTIQSGDNIVFSINASGLTIGTAMYKCDDLPTRMREAGRGAPPDVAAAAVTPPQVRTRRRSETPAVRIESVGLLGNDPSLQRDTVTMSATAAEICLEQSRYDRVEIDLLIYGGVYRTHHVCEPALASMIAGKLAMNDGTDTFRSERTFCFDVMTGATGVLTACHLTAEAVRSGRHRRALVVASEVDLTTEQPIERQLGLRQTASALILDASAAAEGFGAFSFSYFDGPGDGLRSFVDLSVAGGEIRFQRAPDLHALYLEAIAAAVDRHLDETGVPAAGIAAIFAPQSAPGFPARVADRVGLSATVVDVADGSGDLFTSSFPYALAHARTRGMIAPGDVGLVVGAGAGLHVACALYYF
jgi:3-oxoacyl-[acyl-carrier-protein] synthase III